MSRSTRNLHGAPHCPCPIQLPGPSSKRGQSLRLVSLVILVSRKSSSVRWTLWKSAVRAGQGLNSAAASLWMTVPRSVDSLGIGAIVARAAHTSSHAAGGSPTEIAYRSTSLSPGCAQSSQPKHRWPGSAVCRVHAGHLLRLGLDAVSEFGDLVVDRSALSHQRPDLPVGVHHRGVVAAAEELTDLRQ